MQIPDSYLQELSARAEIEPLISPYVNLKRSGRLLMGLCPFHNEKTPSFAVYPDNNSFYCFGCGAAGSAVNFVMRIENLDFIEAVKALSQRVGMRLPEEQYDDSLSKRRLRVLSANREAARFFHAQLSEPEGRAALEYWLEKRRLSPRIVKSFGLGYAPNRWNALLKHMRAKGFSPEELVDANLVTHSDKGYFFDRFQHRVMVPIIDLRGNVVAFGGRVLDDSKPKYINTSDTIAYKKGRDIYALNFAKNHAKEGQLILAEGYMDAIALHQAGFANAVACLGTALTKEQAQLLSRYAQEVVLAYDADEAGQEAVRRALKILSQTPLKLRVIQLTGGKDPDDIIRTYGAERMKSLIDGAANDIEYRLLAARGNLDLHSPAGKLEYLKKAAQALASFGGQIEQDIYASRLAEELSVSKDAILSLIKQAKDRESRQQGRGEQRELLKLLKGRDLKIDPQRAAHMASAKAEERLLGLLMNHPELYPRLKSACSAGDFVTQFNRRLAEVLFERLEEGRGIEPELLSSCLNIQEIDEIMRMRQLAAHIASPLQEMEDCAKKILAEPDNAPKDVSGLDENRFLGLFEQQKSRMRGA
ncbi:MAG: DNA primase [Oscillospiraceae bacterium]|nr:DNA primase [Oscillospiraceae bacterium]